MALTIYRVSSDLKSYSLLPVDRKQWIEIDRRKLERLCSDWHEPLKVYVRDPARTEKMDFINVGVGWLAFSEEVLKSPLGEIMERSGEPLPIHIDGLPERYFALNILACYNCFDRVNAEYRSTPDGTIVEIKQYSFHPKRIGDQNLFKIPETYRAYVYAVSGRDEPQSEFYEQYRVSGFQGLEFEKLWECEWGEPGAKFW